MVCVGISVKCQDPTPPPPGTSLSIIEHGLTYWIDRLRPDLSTGSQRRRTPPTGVHLVPPDTDRSAPAHQVLSEDDFARLKVDVLDTGGTVESNLFINQRHWLVGQCISRKLDPESLAWLLLASYAHINEAQDPVTNQHEQEFQRLVFDALKTGQLHMQGNATPTEM